jgi:hypothetical protein
VSPVGTIFFWDFYGPRGEGTARHFQRHLEEFLQREKVDGCTTAVEMPSAGQWTVSCQAPPAAAEAVRQALRPRRQREAS